VSENPLVSAIIPTYNSAGFVIEAVESVLAQTYPNIEVVVVDDGSTDGTVARLEEKFGPRIRIIRQEHLGPAVARNAGVRASKGSFVGFLDADDLWMPRKLELSLEPLLRNPKVGVVYTAVLIHELDSGLKYKLPQYTMSGCMAKELFTECRGVNTSTLLVRREALDGIGGFDEEFFRAQDWDLMVRLAEQVEYAHVPTILTERRLHPASLSVARRDLYAKYNLLVIEKAVKRRPDLYGALEADALSRAHFRFGMASYAEFAMREARAEFRRALKCRWGWETANYLLRTFLPVSVVRSLRRRRLASKESRSHA
jgi:glycosyltransferase involved in cell wall biosynthesis